jgi:hypothetical protein
MTGDERGILIARYKAGHAEVVEALAGIAADELDWQPAPGQWSAREVVHHLADSETTSGIRLRRLLVEDAPAIQGYDEMAYARRLSYRTRPIEPALLALQAVRATTAQLLDLMTDADWQRAGVHSESGPYSAARWLEIYAAHAHDHAAQIRANRASWARHRDRVMLD